MNENWEYVPFDQVFEWGAKSSIGSREGKSSGKYKLFIASATEIKFYDSYLESGEFLVFGTGGNPCIHYVNENFAYTNHTEVAKKKLNVNTKFYYYFFQKDRYAALQGTFVGGGIKNSSKKKIGALLVPVPPLEEQERIVAKIEELLSQLDSATKTLDKLKQQLLVFRHAIFVKAFCNVRQEEYYPFKVAFDDDPQNGLYKPKSAYGEGTKILRIDGFYDGKILSDYKFKRLKLTQNEIERYCLKRDDIVINRVNSMPYLGKCALVENLDESIVFESNMMRIKVNKKILNPKYATYYLASHFGRMELIKNAKQAVNQASINQEDVGNAMVPMPKSLADQTETINEIDFYMSIYDNMFATIFDVQKHIDIMRQSILKKAFVGQLL